MGYPPQIQKLLDKYWDAETTVAEEQELRTYFLLHPEHADAHTAYFLMLKEESEIEAPTIPQPLKPGKVRSMWRRTLSAAAVVLVVVVAGLVIQNQNVNKPQNVVQSNTKASVVEIEDPDLAYEEAKQALMLVSRKMRESTSHAETEMNKVEPYTTLLK